MTRHWGLRGKSTLTLLLACLVALVPALLIAWQALDDVRHHFATGYAEQYTLLHMQRVLTPVSRDLALSRRLADSAVTREWLENPDDPALRERFFDEARGYRRQLSGNAYFIVDHASGDYYYNDGQRAFSTEPRYRLSPDDPADAWYDAVANDTASYNINVSQDQKLELTKVWINVKIRRNDELLGLAGGGIDLGHFLDRFIRDSPAGLTPMIVTPRGEIQAHPERQRVAIGRHVANQDMGQRRIQSLLDDEASRARLQSALQETRRHPGGVETLEVMLEGEPRLLAVGYLPAVDWLLVTALDLRAAPLLGDQWLWPMTTTLALILALLIVAFSYATERLILGPLRRLQRSARALANGDFDHRLPTERHDEIGELSRDFTHMARRIERHTQDLEDRVQQRTQALVQANNEMAEARRQVDASLEYASIIQRAILPSRQLQARLPDRHAVLWRPRDRVGGDIYVFHATDRGYLMGVIDCAGHGVPGSLMTMLARAIIDNAILRVGPDDPAALLNETDQQNRATLHKDTLPNSIATHMDVGLVWIEPGLDRLTFAGAKMSLYASDGDSITSYPGGKRALGQKRAMKYRNEVLPLRRDSTYTLCSDGFLDQAGGEHGFGFGNTRFRDMLQRHARSPLSDQVTAYEEELEHYRGELPQRDDITMLCFRFHAISPAPPNSER